MKSLPPLWRHRVKNARPVAGITGRIIAEPNLKLGKDGKGTTITWETNDARGAEVRVVLPKEKSKLVSKGRKGSVELPWATPAHPWRFELYGASEPTHCLARVDIESSGGVVESELEQLLLQVERSGVGAEQLARLISRIALRCVQNRRYPEFFRLWQDSGFHLTPVHFYQPIPDTRELPERLWTSPRDLAGLDMNDAVQLELIRTSFPQFREEYDQFPTTTEDPAKFSLINGRFDATDALVAYCMVRHFRPRNIIEVGSGYSSLITAQAAVKNGNAPLTCIEPFPLDFLVTGFPGLRTLIRKKVEDIDLGFFSQLDSGDILFLDSSHTVKIGGDVNYLFLNILPRLKPGVIVHVHDIFFPFDYPRAWVLGECRFWSEQYLLQAFLAFNSAFEILLCNSYLAARYLEDLKATFPRSPAWGGGSFWMRRKCADQVGASHRAEAVSHPRADVTET